MTTAAVATDADAHPEYLADPEWVAARLDDLGVVIRDCNNQGRANRAMPSAALYDKFAAFALKAQNRDIGDQTQKVYLPRSATAGSSLSN